MTTTMQPLDAPGMFGRVGGPGPEGPYHVAGGGRGWYGDGYVTTVGVVD